VHDTTESTAVTSRYWQGAVHRLSSIIITAQVSALSLRGILPYISKHSFQLAASPSIKIQACAAAAMVALHVVVTQVLTLFQ
jgi:hypothetical protein